MVFVTSEGFIARLVEMGVKPKRLRVMPQWGGSSLETNDEFAPSLESFFIRSKKRLNVVFTGNVGSAQNLIMVLEAIKASPDRNFFNFIFVGDGRVRAHLEKFCEENNLEGCVEFIGRLPSTVMPEIYRNADLLLLPLKSSPAYDLTLPAKLQAYMAAGKPIMAMAGGEVKRIIEEADCGYVCSENNVDGYVRLLHDCRSLTESELLVKGEKAKRFSQYYFDKNAIISNFLEQVRDEVPTL